MKSSLPTQTLYEDKTNAAFTPIIRCQAAPRETVSLQGPRPCHRRAAQEKKKKVPRGRLKELMENATKASQVLSKHRGSYATDSQENDIAWQDVIQLYKPSEAAATPGNTIELFDIVLRPRSVIDGDRSVPEVKRQLQLRFEGEIPVDKFVRASKARLRDCPSMKAELTL